MKSKTILPEEDRKLIEDGSIQSEALLQKCYPALVAAEEEIELKEGSNQILSNKMNHQREEIRSMKDGITIRDSEIASIKKEVEYKDFVIKGYIFNEGQFEKEIEGKNKTILSQISEMEAYEETVKLLEIQVKHHFESSQERLKIIERIHNENQVLIEENAGLKAKVEKYSIYRNS